MKKRIISLILTLSFMLCLPCINANAASDTYGDEAIMHLQNLEILPKNIDSDAYMTRGEFAQAIANITGNREPVAGAYSFGDLPADHRYYDAIQHCVQRGYLGGYGGLIRPDDTISYIEAMTVMARVLNYADYAKNNGDYTLGYYTTAKMLGLLNNTNITSSDDPITNSNAATMIYNAMQCKINRLAEINPLYYTYVAVDKTLAYEMLELNYLKGVMNSNGLVDVSGKENYGKNLVVIDDYSLSAKNMDVAYRNLIGQEVSVYYDDEYNIVSIAPTPKNTTLRITRDNFVGISDLTLKYLEKDVEKKVKIDSEAPYFLNGKPVLDFEAAGLRNAEFADVYLVDNNDDLAFDAVFVNVYTTFVVYSVDSEGIVSSLNDTQSVNLGEENNKETVIYNASGSMISPQDITPDSVISVIESDDFVYAVNVNGNLSGKVSQIDEYSAIINGLECEIPNGTAKYFGGISPGNYINAYFDFDNRLVYVEKNINLSENIHFGFIVNCELDSGFDKSLKIKMFTKEGKMEIYKVRNKFKIGDVAYTASKLTAIPSEFYDNGELRHTIVMYKLSADNEITEITFPKTYLGEDEDGFIQTYSKYKKSLASNGSYYAQIFVNTSTTFFAVPEADFSLEEEYDVIVRAEVPTSTTHTVDAFHFSKNNGFADVIVLYGLPAAVNYNTAMSVVTKISNAIDEEGNEVVKVTHFLNNKETVSVAREADIIAKVSKYKPGDAVRLAILDGTIADCERIYEYETGTFTPSSKAGNYATHSLYNLEGYVAYDDNKFFRVSKTDEKITTSDILFLDGFVYSSAKIMVVEDSAKGINITTGTATDIKVGDHIVLQSRGGTLKFVIVYKDK